MSDVVNTNPSTMAQPGGHYSHAVAANGFVFVSGELPIAPDGTKLNDAPFERQAQQALAAVRLARALFDQAVVDQRAEHAAQRLFGHAQEPQQFAHRQVGPPPDEIQAAMMRPAQPHGGQFGIGMAQVRFVRKQQQVHPPTDHVVAQKLGGGRLDRFRHNAWFVPRFTTSLSLLS